MAARRWTPEQRKRLGALLTERRSELDPRYYVREVFAAERQINLRMAADLENGRPRNFTPLTLRDVVAPAYAVTYQSILAAAAGGDLAAVPDSPPHVPPDLEDVPRRASGPRPAAERASASLAAPSGFVSDETIARARPHADEIWGRLLDLALDGIADPSGGQLFGDSDDDAADWDRYGRRGLPVLERVWLIAALRAREASARDRSAAGLALVRS